MSNDDILQSSFSLGSLSISNRMVMEPILTSSANEDGTVSAQLKQFIMTRAIHQPGLIILEGAYVHPSGKGYIRQLGIDNDQCLPGLQDLVNSVHNVGVPIFAQLLHTGRYAMAKALNAQPVAPSAIAPRLPRDHPRELTKIEIGHLAEAYRRAALRAKTAGFDGIEIQAASGYLLASFLSPYSNHRKDEYGGSLENRCRFLLEVIDAVREAVGNTYPICCRVNADEIMEEGNTVDDLVLVGKLAIEHGVDIMNPQIGWHESQKPVVTMDIPEGHWLPAFRKVRDAWPVPMIAAYGFHKPDSARQLIKSGTADMVGWARPLIADPELPAKIRNGREQTTIPCISCCNGCFGNVFRGLTIACSVNPWTGRENEINADNIIPKNVNKKILVVGGGPAGMQAAIEAARQGHKVTLLEKETRLGGQLRLAAIPPYRQRLAPFLGYLEKQLAEAGVEVRLGVNADAKLIAAESPEVLILALGAVPKTINLSGMDEVPVYNAIEMLQLSAIPGFQRWAVIGGGLIGLETAEYLTSNGKETLILEQTEKIAGDASPFERAGLMRRVRKNVPVYTKVNNIKLHKGGLLTCDQDEKTQEFQVDAVVLAIGMEPNRSLSNLEIPERISVYSIGDCSSVGGILEAVQQGADVGYKL